LTSPAVVAVAEQPAGASHCSSPEAAPWNANLDWYEPLIVTEVPPLGGPPLG